jgi:hypothetical protein
MWTYFISVLGVIYVSFVFKDSLTNYPIFQKYMDRIQLVLVIIAFILLLLGFVYYLGEKKIEYKKDFSFKKFMLGAPYCKNNTLDVNIPVSDVLKIGMSPV